MKSETTRNLARPLRAGCVLMNAARSGTNAIVYLTMVLLVFQRHRLVLAAPRERTYDVPYLQLHSIFLTVILATRRASLLPVH